MSEIRICKYCGMELSEDVPHGLRECHLRAVARIAELEEKQRWRVVADGELPEVYRDEDGDFIRFLVCEGDGGYPFVAMYNGKNWWAGIFVPDITHWMPLPESPNDTQSSTFVYGKDVSRSVK